MNTIHQAAKGLIYLYALNHIVQPRRFFFQAQQYALQHFVQQQQQQQSMMVPPQQQPTMFQQQQAQRRQQLLQQQQQQQLQQQQELQQHQQMLQQQQHQQHILQQQRQQHLQQQYPVVFQNNINHHPAPNPFQAAHQQGTQVAAHPPAPHHPVGQPNGAIGGYIGHGPPLPPKASAGGGTQNQHSPANSGDMVQHMAAHHNLQYMQ